MPSTGLPSLPRFALISMPSGLFEPVWRSATRCSITSRAIANGALASAWKSPGPGAKERVPSPAGRHRAAPTKTRTMARPIETRKPGRWSRKEIYILHIFEYFSCKIIIYKPYVGGTRNITNYRVTQYTYLR